MPRWNNDFGLTGKHKETILHLSVGLTVSEIALRENYSSRAIENRIRVAADKVGIPRNTFGEGRELNIKTLLLCRALILEIVTLDDLRARAKDELDYQANGGQKLVGYRLPENRERKNTYDRSFL